MENEIFVIQQHRIEQHKEFEEAFKISQCNFTEYRTQLGQFMLQSLFSAFVRCGHHHLNQFRLISEVNFPYFRYKFAIQTLYMDPIYGRKF